MKKIILSAFAISALTLVSCNTDFERDVNNMTVSTGKADFSKFVSVGNSLTSGFRDGALYLRRTKRIISVNACKTNGISRRHTNFHTTLNAK